MADKMSGLLVDVAEDPDRLAEFEANPKRELNRAGLTDTQKTAVLTRDSRKVRAVLGSATMAANDDVLELPPPPPPPPPTAPPPARPPAAPPTRRRPPTKRKPAKRRPRKPAKRRPARKRTPSRRSRKGPARKKR
jgi:hypothetical protein